MTKTKLKSLKAVLTMLNIKCTCGNSIKITDINNIYHENDYILLSVFEGNSKIVGLAIYHIKEQKIIWPGVFSAAISKVDTDRKIESFIETNKRAKYEKIK